MGHYVDDPVRDAMLCASHDAWVTHTPYDDDYDYDDDYESEDNFANDMLDWEDYQG